MAILNRAWRFLGELDDSYFIQTLDILCTQNCLLVLPPFGITSRGILTCVVALRSPGKHIIIHKLNDIPKYISKTPLLSTFYFHFIFLVIIEMFLCYRIENILTIEYLLFCIFITTNMKHKKHRSNNKYFF